MTDDNSFVTDDDVMTLTEIARFLKVSEKTVLRMVQGGAMPGAKVSNQWRFLRTVVEDWLSAKMQIAPNEDLVNVVKTAKKVIPITKLISADRVVVDLKPGSKREILSQLVQPLALAGILTDAKGHLDKLLEREEAISTAVASGIAFPHAREPENSGVKESCIVLGICREGTDFDSLDGKKTKIFVMICATSDVVHLRLMAKMSLMLRRRDVIKSLNSATSERDVVSLMIEADLELFSDMGEKSGKKGGAE
jgi:PTS system nitrogen regulatory IIA component